MTQAAFTQLFRTLVHDNLARKAASNLPADSKHEWRQWIMQMFEQYPERVSGNEGVNLVAGTSPTKEWIIADIIWLGWHGTTEEACWSIAASNFTDPSEQQAGPKKDPGCVSAQACNSFSHASPRITGTLAMVFTLHNTHLMASAMQSSHAACCCLGYRSLLVCDVTLISYPIAAHGSCVSRH